DRPQTAPAADGDDDGDGVPNLLDRCLYTPPGLRVDDVGCPLEPTRRDDVRLILAAAGGLLILLALGAVRWVRRTREEAAPEEHVPLLLFAPEPGRAPLPPPPPGARPLAPPRPASGPPPAIAVPAGGWPAGAAWPGPGPVPSSPAPLWPEAAAPRPGSFGAPPAPRAGNGGADEPDAAPAADDSTLRLLPGRLELVAGAGDREIRFVQGPSAVTEITVGRQAGPAMRHLQLPAPTVSRLHARLRYEEGRWSIANLSRTNPVVVNGAPLGGAEARAPLREGDRIEVGEYIFIFHER
ncbi:MAG: FHA domain-containing protein, partial [Gemmatimonadetes bacterium]|nr:FHA domain-containing protein [Gemmatimonadota bacterium]